MKVSVYLKKSSSSTSSICFRVREKNVDIKVVSPLVVHDKYWDADTLSYKRTTAVPATDQKRLPLPLNRNCCPNRLPPSLRKWRRHFRTRQTAHG